MEETKKNKYVTYQSMVNSVNEGLSDVCDVCEDLKMQSRVESLKEMKQRLNDDVFSVGIMGEFNRGKSTVINALLGQDIVPADILPCSAAPNYVRWGTTAKAVVNFKDGHSEAVSVDALSTYITKITDEYEEISRGVSEAVVYYPNRFCQNGVQIIDTPGLNDDERMSYISEQVLPTLDAVIMVLVPDSPFSKTELDFVVSKVLTSDLGRIIFVLNKADLLSEKDLERLLGTLHDRIQESVARKIAEISGDSEELIKEAQNKVGGVRLYPISARNALEAKKNGDKNALEASGMPAFEEALSKLLTEERGMLKLMSPVNQLRSAISEASNAAATFYNALDIDYDEFKKIHEKQKEDWKKRREEKEEQIRLLRGKASNVYGDLVNEVPSMYDELQKELHRTVDEYEINGDDLKSNKKIKEASEKIAEALQSTMKNCISKDIERLSLGISERIGEDLSYVSKFGTEIESNIREIQLNISMKTGLPTPAIIAIDAATNIVLNGFVSIGGILEGWKANGLPGAIVGGVGGAAAGIASMLLLANFFPLIPVLMVGGAITTLVGKKLVEKFFPNVGSEREVQKIRNAAKSSIDASITEIKEERKIENWLKTQTEEMYKTVSEKADAELEGLLKDFEEQMEAINTELIKKESNQENAKEHLKDLNESLKKASDLIEPVYERLSAALNLSDAVLAGGDAE